MAAAAAPALRRDLQLRGVGGVGHRHPDLQLVGDLQRADLQLRGAPVPDLQLGSVPVPDLQLAGVPISDLHLEGVDVPPCGVPLCPAQYPVPLLKVKGAFLNLDISR